MVRPLLAVLVSVAVAASPSLRAAAATQSTINDPQNLFSTAARERAEKKLAVLEEQIQQEEKISYPVFIETVALDLGSDNPLMRLWKSRQANRLLAAEARKRAEAAGVPGLYIFINANPHAVQVVAWPSPDDGPFSTRDCDLLRRQVSHHLSWDGPDNALQTATATLREQFEEHHPRETFTHSSVFFFSLVVLALVAVWLLLSVMSRRLSSGGRLAILKQTPSFGPALLAAQLGLPGAFWIYDRFFVVPRDLLPAGEPEPLFPPLPVPMPEPTPEHEPGEHASSSS